MSGFTPQLPPIYRPTQDVLLGRLVPVALRRPSPVAKPLGPLRLALTGAVTAGWWPCRALQKRISAVTAMHARQFELAEQLLQSTSVQLADSADPKMPPARTTRAEWLGRASEIFLLLSIVLCAWHLSSQGWSGAAIARYFVPGQHIREPRAMLSIAMVSLAYVILVARINSDIAQIRRFTIAVNAAQPGAAPVPLPNFVWGVRPIYFAIGIAMTWLGWWWSLPMMWAWGAFFSYAIDHSYEFRVALADRLESASNVEPLIPVDDLCPNAKCRSALPADAEFCPRCGEELSMTR